MALKPLQSAFYPREQPKLQPGLERAELDADYDRLQAARKPLPGLSRAELDASYERLLTTVEEAYGPSKTRIRR